LQLAVFVLQALFVAVRVGLAVQQLLHTAMYHTWAMTVSDAGWTSISFRCVAYPFDRVATKVVRAAAGSGA
jgi:hypothetical protein